MAGCCLPPSPEINNARITNIITASRFPRGTHCVFFFIISVPNFVAECSVTRVRFAKLNTRVGAAG